jgi:hypothetical protein
MGGELPPESTRAAPYQESGPNAKTCDKTIHSSERVKRESRIHLER